MTSAKEMTYSRHVERGEKLLTRMQRGQGRGSFALKNAFDAYHLAASTRNLPALEPYLFLFRASLSQLDQSTSKLGLFTPGFCRLISAFGKGALPLFSHSKTGEEKELLEGFLTLFIIGTAALFTVSKQVSHKEIEGTPPDVSLQEELLATLFFESGVLKRILGDIIDVLNIKGEKEKTFHSLFTLAVALTLYFSFEKSENRLESLSPYIEKPLRQLLLVTRDQDSALTATLTAFLLSLEKNDFQEADGYLTEFISSCGYSRESLLEDQKTMQQLVQRIKQAFQAGRENQPTTLHMVC